MNYVCTHKAKVCLHEGKDGTCNIPIEVLLGEENCPYRKRRVNYFIQQGKCPYCGEKLTRGKKNKQNDYKRVWTCAYCDKVLQVEKGD